jgi:RNA polymerase sigma-70 factor, ECF subfamily
VTSKPPRLRLVPTEDAQSPASPVVDDARLVAAMRNGVAGMAGAFHDRVRPSLEKTVTRLLGAADCDRDDVIQVAMIEMLRSLNRYRGECSLDTWACTIAAHSVYKHLRRRGLERSLFAPEPPAEMASQKTHQAPVLRGMVQRVAQHLREMVYDRAWTFLLHDVHGYSLDEVASLTGVSVSAAQSRLVRGRRDLHERIAADPDLAGGLDSLEESSS